MGKVCEWTFYQTKHTNGQRRHEKVLNITKEGNANCNYNDISPHSCQTVIVNRTKQ